MTNANLAANRVQRSNPRASRKGTVTRASRKGTVTRASRKGTVKGALMVSLLAALTGWATLASAESPQLIEPGIVYGINPGMSQAEISGAIYQFTAESDVEVGGSTSSMVALAPGMKVEVTYLMHPDRYREVVFLEQLPDDLEIEEF